jgi:hypothetical protein
MEVRTEQATHRVLRWHCRPMTEEETALRLSAAIARAGDDPAQWPGCLDELSATLDGAAVLLTLRPPHPEDVASVVAVGITPSFVRSYAETYYARDPWVERMSMHPPNIVFGYELVPRWALLRSEFYQAWMHPQDLLPERSIAGLILNHGARPLSTFAAFRRRGSRLLQLEDVALLRRLLPHLQGAVRRTAGHGEDG